MLKEKKKPLPSQGVWVEEPAMHLAPLMLTQSSDTGRCLRRRLWRPGRAAADHIRKQLREQPPSGWRAEPGRAVSRAPAIGAAADACASATGAAAATGAAGHVLASSWHDVSRPPHATRQQPGGGLCGAASLPTGGLMTGLDWIRMLLAFAIELAFMLTSTSSPVKIEHRFASSCAAWRQNHHTTDF